MNASRGELRDEGNGASHLHGADGVLAGLFAIADPIKETTPRLSANSRRGDLRGSRYLQQDQYRAGGRPSGLASRRSRRKSRRRTKARSSNVSARKAESSEWW